MRRLKEGRNFGRRVQSMFFYVVVAYSAPLSSSQGLQESRKPLYNLEKCLSEDR